MMKKLKSSKGMTLVELIVAMVILIIIVSGLALFYAQMAMSARATHANTGTVVEARTLAEKFEGGNANPTGGAAQAVTVSGGKADQGVENVETSAPWDSPTPDPTHKVTLSLDNGNKFTTSENKNKPFFVKITKVTVESGDVGHDYDAADQEMRAKIWLYNMARDADGKPWDVGAPAGS
ncbi:MAG: type II secretion system GspH family protein [Clostridiales bacterium]|jgi:Tfp pilus assembly protein PilV|nr:type II secretion system GspH family protein [Clostridiales bacterium]